MRTLNVDIETYSSADITKTGAYKYAEADDFEILMIAFSIDNEPVTCLDMYEVKKHLWHAAYETFKIALFDKNVKKYAFNANFERVCLAKHFERDMPPEEFVCTMVNATRIGLPASLDKCGEALKLDIQKDKTGKALINYFSKPCRPTKANGGRTRNLPEHAPEKWQQFIEYCIRDVEVEQLIAEKIRAFPVPKFEQKLWSIDQHINDRGVHLDESLMTGAVELDRISKEQLMNEAIQLTGLDNPNSPTQLLKWLNAEGLEIPDLQKKTVTEWLKVATGKAKKMLELRLQMSKTSVKKYTKMHEMMCKDHRVRGVFQFYGAGTGRWAGRGVQLQNLTKHHISDDELDIARMAIKQQEYEWLDMLLEDSYQDLLSQLVRTTFTAKEGYEFAVSDFSAIEARVIAWYAGEKWRLQVFETHGKIYEASASQMFNVPIESIGKGSPLRQKGKVAELACIAKGQMVLTNNGEKPIEKVLLSDKVWDGYNFVKHDGVIKKGIKEVITYEGLTATKDHLVFIEGKNKPVQFGEAATSGAHLLRSGYCRSRDGLDTDNKPRKTMEEEMERPNDIRQMCKLPKNFMASFLQFEKRFKQRMSVLFTTKTSTRVAIQKNDCSKTKMYKSERFKLQKLWNAWHRIQVRKCFRGCALHGRNCRWGLKQEPRNRSHRCKWPLRKRKSKVGNSSTKLPKSAQVYDILNAGPLNRYTVEGKLVHNCGYQGGVGALKAMGALEMGLKENELQGLINEWRNANPNIVSFWYSVQEAAVQTVKTRQVNHTHGLKFYMFKGALMIELPSGRSLSYLKPKLRQNRWGSDVIVFKGQDSITRKWTDIDTYGGKLVENIVQATARDLLAVSLVRLEKAGYEVVAHVHDEIIVEVPKGSRALSDIEDIMSQPVRWAEGLSLDSDGFVSEFYMKD